jgi:hypothetical protein
MKEKAIKIFQAICLNYELPKGLTPQEEENLLWEQFNKYNLKITKKQLIKWLKEGSEEVYIIQPLQIQKKLEIFELPEEKSLKLISLQEETIYKNKQPFEIKIKINNNTK